MGDVFNGFSREVPRFYDELRENNNRDWFQVHKQRYRETVLLPMCDFIETFGPRLDGLAPFYVADPRPNGGSVFRIYRDARFSKDKTPYKEHLACQFRHQAGKDAHAPGFYMQIDHTGIRVGGGIWMPPPPKLAMIRRAIDENSAKWNIVRDDPSINKLFEGINGVSLKTAPKGYSVEHPNIVDIRRKSFFLMRQLPTEVMFSAKLLDDVEETFEAALPFMKFMTTAVDLPF
jgi:uncharacterized protein (TIGR02453 family)